MYSDLLLFLFTPNLISILIWSTVTLTLIPDRPIFGSLLWIFLFLLTIFYLPINQPYKDLGAAQAVGEALLYMIIMFIFVSLSAWAIAIFISNIINSRKKIAKNNLRSLKVFNKIVFIAYGLLLGFWIFLFCANFLEEYKPAWEAYGIVFLSSILFLLLFLNIKKYRKYYRYIQQKQIYFFVYSLLTTIVFLLAASFSFSFIAIAQTKKIIQKYQDREVKYCIQNIEQNTWLDLTPLVAWNKPSGYFGAGKNHAVLVVQAANSLPDLYNWSYKSRTWDYITTGFKPDAIASPSSLKCILEENYISKIPLVIPNNILLNRSQERKTTKFTTSIANFFSIK